mgnify:FL=1
MSEANFRAIDFVKNIFSSHLEEKNIEESYKNFTDDADIYGLVQNGSIHGLPAIKAALKTFLTLTNVNCTLTFSEESEKFVSPNIYLVNFVMDVKHTETEQVLVLRISAVAVENNDDFKISSLNITVVDRNSMPLRYFVDEVELGYESELYRDILSEDVSAGILGCFNEEGFPLYVVDDNFVKILGYSNKKELLLDMNSDITNIVYRDDLPRVQEYLKSCTEPGDKYEITYRVRKKNGRFIWIKDNGKIVKAQDKIALVGVCHDVTENIENKQKQGQRKLFRRNLG